MLLPVILCGGAGSRLWPLSRVGLPKQFLALTGELTMLQQVVTRLDSLSQASSFEVRSPVLVCNELHRFLAASQLMGIGIGNATILLEPAARNTAPALSIAAFHAYESGRDDVMLVMPADHAIADVPAFHRAVQAGYDAASRGAVVTFGVLPQYPETGYGYIRYRSEDRQTVFEVEGFTEKPGLELARTYLESGNYLWNSGIFMLRTSTWINAIRQFRPDIYRLCQAAMNSARHDLDFIRPDSVAFNNCPSESIDYAVMEELSTHPEWASSMLVVPMQAGWCDVGTWDALWRVSERDPQGNAVVGDAVFHEDCTDSLLLSTGRLLVSLGVKDLVVVETSDAVLVADKGRMQEVKHMVDCLAQSDRSMLCQHRKVHRPWGWYDRIDGGERFQVKRIFVNPAASLSLQLHKHRAEHWIVVKGVAEVTHGERRFQLQENESTYIPVGHVHRLSNPGVEPLEIIEIQSGSYLGEDDIVRLDDVYGRATPWSPTNDRVNEA